MGQEATDGTHRGFGAVPMIYFDRIVLERTMELTDWLPIAQELGLDATEIHDRSLRSRDHAYLEGLADAIREHGLGVSQLVGAADLTNPDRALRAAELDRVRENIEAAALLGASCLRMTAGQEHPGLSTAEGIRLAEDGLLRALESAERAGVTLAYENHWKDYFWERPDLTRHMGVFLALLERLQDTPLRVNFDCSNNLVQDEDPVELLRQVRPWVVHVHCSDRLRRGEYPHAVTGEGVVDYPALFGLLRGTGYAGWLSIEYNGTEGLDGLRQSILNVRRLWTEASPA